MSEREKSDEKRLQLLAELMFAKKIKSGFYKIRPEWKARTSRNIPIIKYLNPEEKVFFKMCQKGKELLWSFKCGTNTEKIQTPVDWLQRESAQKGKCYTEEYTNTNSWVKHDSLANRQKCWKRLCYWSLHD